MNKPTIPEVIDRFMAYHEQNRAWGWLHVVLDDDNVDDGDVQGCIDMAAEHGDTEAAELGKILLQMSKTQRARIGDWPYRFRAAKRNAAVSDLKTDEPREGVWHWVRVDGAEWWLAKRHSKSAGGWTNEDTWEDFNHEVKVWQPIAGPIVEAAVPPAGILPPHSHEGETPVLVAELCPTCGHELDQPPARTIRDVTEVYVFASNGFVNTCKRGEANTTLSRMTAEVELAVGQRMIVERGQDALTLEVLPL